MTSMNSSAKELTLHGHFHKNDFLTFMNDLLRAPMRDCYWRPEDHECIEEEAANLTLYQAGWWIHLVWLPILVPVGIAGNAISFVIMTQAENRRVSCHLYMAALAVADSVALLRKGYEWLMYMFSKPYEQLECQILAYIGLGSVQYGMFLIVTMTFDRVLAVKFPLKAAVYCSNRRARITIIVLLVVACLYNIPHYITARQIGNPPYTCSTFTYQLPYLDIYAWTTTVLNFFLPFVGLIIMNVIIVRVVRQRKKTFFITHSTNSRWTDRPLSSPTSTTLDQQLSVTLCLVGVFFVLLNVPQCVRLTMFLFIDRWASPYNHAVYIFVFHLSNKAYYTNNGINFFLYSIGGHRFRKSLRHLCGCFICNKCRDLRNNHTRTQVYRPYVVETSSISSIV